MFRLKPRKKLREDVEDLDGLEDARTDLADEMMYTKAKSEKKNRINWMKEETPEQMASTSWLETLVYNVGKELVLTPDKIRVTVPKVPIDEWVNTYEDWVADMMEKYGTESTDSENPLRSIYEDIMRHYIFAAVMEAFPNGFDYKLTEEMIDISWEKVKKALGTWKEPAPIW